MGTLALVVLLIVVRAGVASVLRAVGEGRASVVAASMLALLCVLPERCARVTGSLITGLVISAVVVGVAGLIASRFACPTETVSPLWTRAARVTAFVMLAALLYILWSTWLWDEASSHLPLSAALARGVIPLEHPLFPGQPVHYHIGYPVLGAVVRVFTGLPHDVCLDIVGTLALVALLWCIHDVTAALCRSALAPALALFVVLCADGPLAAFLADGWGLPLPGKELLPTSWVNNATFPPMTVTNVFQHPAGLGMPIAAAVLLVVTGGRGLGRFAVGALLTGLCAQAQTVYFAVVGLGLGVVALSFVVVERDVKRLLLRLLLAAAAGVLALALGNLVVTAASDAVVFGQGYFADAAIAKNLLSFGVVVVAPVVALLFVRRVPIAQPQLFAALVTCGAAGFVVGNSTLYVRSWDIVKFFGAGGFFASFVVVWLLSEVARSRVVVVVVVAVSCWSGVVWIARHGPLNGRVVAWQRDSGIDADAVVFDEAFGSVIEARARILVKSRELGRVGYLVPGTNWRTHRDTRALLIDREVSDRDFRAQRHALAHLDRRSLDELAIDYVAVKTGEVSETTQRAIFDDVTRFERVEPHRDPGPFQLYRIVRR